MDSNRGSPSKTRNASTDDRKGEDDETEKETNGTGISVNGTQSQLPQPSSIQLSNDKSSKHVARVSSSLVISGRTSREETAFLLEKKNSHYERGATREQVVQEPIPGTSGSSSTHKKTIFQYDYMKNADNWTAEFQDVGVDGSIPDEGDDTGEEYPATDECDQVNISTQESHKALGLVESVDSYRSGAAQTVISHELLETKDNVASEDDLLDMTNDRESEPIAEHDKLKETIVPTQEGTQTDNVPEYLHDLKLRDSEIDRLQRLHEESKSHEADSLKRRKSTKTKLGSRRTISASIGYSQYRKEGEAFLDLEFVADDDGYEEIQYSGQYADNEYDKNRINSQIVARAQEIKQLVSQKKMGLPQFHSDSILDMTDKIIVEHSSSIYDIFSVNTRPNSTASIHDRTDHFAQNIRNIATRSETILAMLKDKGGTMSATNNSNQISREATDHLEKMVRKLHCRHRRMKKLAEEIIAKRWKLVNMNLVNEKRKKGEAVPTANRGKRMDHKRGKEKKTGQKFKDAEMKVLFANPMAKLKTIGKTCGGQENWGDNDPLWKAINKVGVEKFEKCYKNKHQEDAPVDTEKGKTVRIQKRQKLGQKLVTERKSGVFPLPIAPSFEAHISKSAITIFFNNYSRMVVRPSTFMPPSPSVEHRNMINANVDKSELTNDFVEQWKRRSYAVGIFLIILTALLHCSYLTGPRMGDNYVTYTISNSIGASLFLAPTGIYGLIFLGYLFGGMGVIKTAAAMEHNQTVKDYFKQRRKKFYLWYGLAIYFLLVWTVRTGMWFVMMESTEQEIRSIFRTTFYYNQLPSRLLYTQYMLGCCGANGPKDYKDSDKIGLPKSCYVRVSEYDNYFKEPMPAPSGCLEQVYKYNAMAMSVICSLSLIVWLLVVITLSK